MLINVTSHIELLSEVKSIGDILTLQALAQPNKDAVIFKGQPYSYRQLYRMAAGLSRSLPQGVGHVGVCLPRSVHYLIAYFAILFKAAVVVPIDPELTSKEVASTVHYCDIRFVICDERTKQLVADLPNVQSIVLHDEDIEKYEQIGASPDFVPEKADPAETAVLLHTSGAAGNPKRVMLTHQGLIRNASAHARQHELTPEDRVLVALPMHFGYCNTAQILCHLLLGGTLVLLDGILTPHRFFGMVQEYCIHVTTLVPTLLLQLLSFQHGDKYDVSSLRQVTFGGAPFPVQKISELQEKYPAVAFCQTYGQTEAGPRVSSVVPTFRDLSGSVGTLLEEVEVRIVSDDNAVLDPGEVGEITVKSPGLMKGYYKRPEETAKTIIDGWLYTGDLGYVTEEGLLYIVGRRKNIIIRAGVNIYPEELESYFLEHPLVQEVLVYGKPHDVWGEVPHAQVVPKDQSLTLQELHRYAAEGLAKYKQPTFEFVEALPKTYNNKIKRNSQTVSPFYTT